MCVELEPHPGGADYFLLEEILRIRACLGCRSRPAECATTRDVAVLFDGRLIDAARGCVRVRVHMWVSCQVTLMMGACCMMSGGVRYVEIPVYHVGLSLITRSCYILGHPRRPASSSPAAGVEYFHGRTVRQLLDCERYIGSAVAGSRREMV